ncbi:DUF3313 domain-containing protein [Aureimonas populi]|uniref:DUF3313 domain-containing protein n=1 Tax=Aureimonas populi TaxID=1701758 RepID=A0ABW5CNQ9_9HYPH|nr:DUF3313 domain-containing protein [Aureimonas populi]
MRLRFAGLLLSLGLALPGCASVPLKEAGTLSSYANLGEPKGKVGKSRTYVDAQGLAGLQTVSITPTAFSPAASSRIKTDADRLLVANALDRAVCVSLSDKYRIVPSGQPADLVVRTVVTDIVPTDKTLAGVATAVSLGSSAVLPVSVPRLPVGLGGLAVEAEAVDGAGFQRAAMVWARGANSIQNNPRVSEVGDAYGLASKFGNDFARMLVTGEEPKALDIALPSGQRTKSWFGGKPKYAACDAFGRAPGLMGVAAAKIGAPPQWTDGRQVAAAQ